MSNFSGKSDKSLLTVTHGVGSGRAATDPDWILFPPHTELPKFVLNPWDEFSILGDRLMVRPSPLVTLQISLENL